MKIETKVKRILFLGLIAMATIIMYGGFYLEAIATNEYNDLNLLNEENNYIDILNAEIMSIPNQVFNGKNITPELYVSYNGMALIKDVDYTVEYFENLNAGVATVKVNGIGMYNGTKLTNFNIEVKSIVGLKCSTSASYYSYTGKPIEANFNIYDAEYKLEKNKDYTVTYKNNKNTGKATAIITGKGNYVGTFSYDFLITPAKAVISSVVFNSKYTTAKITWEKDNQASGYQVTIAESKNGPYKHLKYVPSNSTTSYTAKGLNKNKTYYFKVRAFKTIDGKNRYSQYTSDPKTNTELLAEITLTSTSSGTNRNTNLSLASKKINGLVLKPGQTFNWFKVVGPASKSKGYKMAIIFVNGKSVYGYGGGVCQVSTTLYQASLKAGLKIVERHTHSKAVSYTKAGKDATVAYGSKNLRIKNNKNYSIRFVTSSNKGSTTCKIYRVSN